MGQQVNQVLLFNNGILELFLECYAKNQPHHEKLMAGLALVSLPYNFSMPWKQIYRFNQLFQDS
jgi:hypothetical protein